MIAKKVRNFDLWVRRYGVHIALIIIMLAFASILILLAAGVSRLAEQSTQEKQIVLQIQDITKQLSKNADTRTNQINGIDKHLDCIVEFFSQPDHSQKSIADIETCQLTNSVAEKITPHPATKSNDTSKQATTSNPSKIAPKPSIIDTLIGQIDGFLKGL